MLIRYLSDLHLEFINPNKLHNVFNKIQSSNKKEVCILAGDIDNPYKSNYDNFMKHVSNNFKKTFVIAGNHEYYNETKTIEETNIFLDNYFKKFNNISFLNNSCEYYENYYFVGTVLWSRITDPKYKINDMYRIPKFDSSKYNQLNSESIEFLKCIKQNNNNIIITHHLPSHSLTDDKYNIPEMLPYHQWFSNDMDKFIDEHKNNIKCWFYGHTHTPSNKLISNIPFLCNPIGYPKENTTVNYNADIIIYL